MRYWSVLAIGEFAWLPFAAAIAFLSAVVSSASDLKIPAEPGGGAGVAAGAAGCCACMVPIIRNRTAASAVIVVLILSSIEVDSLEHGFRRPPKCIGFARARTEELQ